MKTRALVVGLALASIALVPTLSRPAPGPTDVAGIPAAQVGDHGPLGDFTLGSLELVGHSDITPPGATKPLGNNGGIALIGHCAFVGRWHDYSGTNNIQIVDVADSTNPHSWAAFPARPSWTRSHARSARSTCPAASRC